MNRQALILAFVGGVTAASAQVPAPTPIAPAFAVISVKPQADPSASPRPVPESPGRFYRRTTTLRQLIRFAYELQDQQVVGGPDWIGTARYEIDARTSGEPAPAVVRQMVQRLLADRFRLRTSRETRELPVYELALARSDGTLGSGLRQVSAADCSAAVTSQPGQAGTCGTLSVGANAIFTGGITMAEFGGMLSNVGPMTGVDRMVIDRTGLTDRFAFNIPFASPRMPPGANSGPSIFTALREYLGLKLEPARGPVEVLVINSAEMPSPD